MGEKNLDEIEEGKERQRKVSLASWRPGKSPKLAYVNWETRLLHCQEQIEHKI